MLKKPALAGFFSNDRYRFSDVLLDGKGALPGVLAGS
jgi:hypothetical protein